MRRHLYAATALLALALTVAGCGDKGEEAGTNPSPSASADPGAKGLKFAQCMRENGVNVPDPEPGKGVMMKFDGSVSQEQVQKAMEACREWAPQGMNGNGPKDPQQEAKMRKYSQCMRDNGVEAFPDPEGTGIRLDKSVADDPDFKAAEQACAKEMQ
ncbi:hypothetical protein KZZ52_01630 [Dactylosporangium sp. AC04546]|uniref:hypothetical protein n=1 Tax=Dactylosporangium sp. AC04546 TaxID=2862460 RepID=UPI001EE002CC|nr:hypothetical protein [Dactylosporangium sp. AC04546]WVK84165.1 hypothetical protein KZZ52_01630 [Dactylosporangium sp. AC04546]